MAKQNSKVQSVESLNIERYTGTWYEILRLPNRFEKGLKCITANYTIRHDGKLTVLNRGHKISDPALVDEAKGKAWQPDPKHPGRLKVQFFWPFSGDYWILSLDPDYRFVLIGEPSLKYLWILSRTPKLDETIVDELLQKALAMGYDLKPVIRVEQDCN